MPNTRKRMKKNLDNSSSQGDWKTNATESLNMTVETLKFNNEIDIIRTVNNRKKEDSGNGLKLNKTQKTESSSILSADNVEGRTRSKSTSSQFVKNNKGSVTNNLIMDDSSLKNGPESEDLFTETVRAESRISSDQEETVMDINIVNNRVQSPEMLLKITNAYTLNENSNDSIEDENIALKNKGRKKRIINYASLLEDQDTDNSDNIEKPNQSNRNLNIDGSLKRKRGRQKGYKKVPKVSKTTENDSYEAYKLKKRGRPRGKFAPKNLHHVKLVDTILQQLNNSSSKITPTNSESDVNTSTLDTTSSLNITVKEESKSQQNADTITCAVCKLEMAKKAWAHHKYRYHNNLTWRIGDEPLDLNDSELVMSILNDIYKRKKPLYCENCNTVKKSVMGYLSHKSVCQRSAAEIQASKVTCVNCGRSFMPVSVDVHMKICNVLKTDRETRVPVIPKDDEVLTGVRRKAATKAESFIKDFSENDVSEGTNKNRRIWYVNFDFRSTPKGTRLIQDEINKKGSATCWFPVCNFESSLVDEMTTHISNCQFKPSQGFTCKYCFVTYSNEEKIIEHSNQNHKVVKDEEFECDVAEEYQFEEEFNVLDFLDQSKLKVVVQSKKNVLNGIDFLLKYRYFPTSAPLLYPPAHEWTYKFCQYNFGLNDLFSHWRMSFNDLTKLDVQKLSKYLPKQKFSVCTASVQEKTYKNLLELKYDWKRFKLFQSELLHKDTSTIFCGGTITAMAWLPTPYDEEDHLQILAVSTNSNFNKGYAIHQLYEESGLIQFWNCGSLKNCNTMTERPVLQFCLAHDHGPVWCLEWCPSGCYDKVLQRHSPQRLGLLAVGSADSFIYLYSICLPDSRSGKLFKLNPVLKLQLNVKTELAVNGIEAHVTKLSWTRAKGHSYIAAGYSNGMVAIFDLNSISSLLKVTSDNADFDTLLPYQILPAHYHAITALYLYHLNDGRRWLMSGSLDRTIKYWDLENPLVPISNFTKFIVTDGVWLNHWITSVHTYEDCCGGGLTLSSINQLRNYECSSASILHSNSCVSSISGSDWTNSFIQGNAAGEITGFFPHQLFYYLENDKSFRTKKGVLGYARVVEKDASVEERIKNEEEKNKKLKASTTKNNNLNFALLEESTKNGSNQEPTSYEEADDKYGLVFCDMEIDSIKELPNNLSSYYKSNTDKFYPTSPHIYPLQSIKQIVINPNSGSYYYYATGYQAGFIRISSINNIGKNSFIGPQT